MLSALLKRFINSKKGYRHSEITSSFFGEDILINRLLKTKSCGIYIDVGCNHPIDGSNTFRLYSDGWTGLTIDPNPIFATAFRRYRPRDIHVTAGIAVEPGSMTYHMFDPDVFNTFSESQASEMIAQGRCKLGEKTVPCLRLEDVVATYLPNSSIDILNVDCEGMDLEVLQSLNLAVNRPIAIIIEDTGGLEALRDGKERSELDKFLRKNSYSPIAQSAWSAIFVANDWEDLVLRSSAFDKDEMRRGYMPRR